jgi:hypothetical protein
VTTDPTATPDQRSPRRVPTWLVRPAVAVSAAIATAVVVAIPTTAFADALTPAITATSPTATASSSPDSPPPGAGLPAWKKSVDVRINLRLATLSRLHAAIGAATNLSAADKSTLTDLVSADKSGLAALKARTDAESTVAAVRSDAHAMIDDYRVYLLVVPKVRFTVAADAETGTITKLRTVHDDLAKVAAQLAGGGKDTSTETAQLASMAQQLDAAASALTGQVATLLAIQPGPNGEAIHAQVVAVRSAVRGARDRLRASVVLAKRVRVELAALSG